MSIGENIKKYRNKIGLSQKELGERLSVSQAMVAQYENGKRVPKVETIQKIANALNINAYELYSSKRDDGSIVIDLSEDADNWEEHLSAIFPRKAPNELKTLDDLEDFFCYLESLGYDLSISDYNEMIKYKLSPYDENDYLIGISDMKRDNITFFHRKEFIKFQQEVVKTIDYELYKQFTKPPDPPQS